MILMLAPAPNMPFGAAPSGASYVSDAFKFIKIMNDSTADQTYLQSAGCFTLSPFGGWWSFTFNTLAELYAADTGALYPGITGFPQYSPGQVLDDSGNTGLWYKSGTGHGSGNWTQVSTRTLADAALSAEAAAASAAEGRNYSIVAAADAFSAGTSAALALGAGGVLGPEATYAALVSHIASYANNDLIRVTSDETRGGQVSIYKKVAGSPVLQDGGQVSAQYDQLARPVIPGRLLDCRSLGFHIRKAHDDVNSGARKYLTGLVVSDSLGLISFPGGPQQWATIEAGHFKSGPVLFADLNTNFVASAPGAGQLVTTRSPTTSYFTCTNNIKTDYTEVWTGCDQTYTAGQVGCYSLAVDGTGALCDYIRVLMLRLPTAGVYKIWIANSQICPPVGDPLWVNPVSGQIAAGGALTGSELLVDVNGAAGMVIVELSVALGQWHIQLELKSGTGTAIPPSFEVHSQPAINIYRLSVGSNDFGNETTAASPHMAALIANLNPDWVYIGSDDPVASYQNFLPEFETALAAASLSYKPLVMIEGNAYNTTDTTIGARIDWCKDYVSSRLDWVVVDLLALVGGLAEATREGVQGDGIHPSAANPIAYSSGWRAWAASHNLLAQPITGVASASDVTRNIGKRLIDTSNVISALLSTSRTETAPMTWSKIGSSSAGTSVARGDDNAITLATSATANDVVTAYINEIRPIFGRANGQRALNLAGGISFMVMPLVANTTGVARVVWRDGSNGAAYAGALVSVGFGVIIENLTLTLIAFDGTSEVRSSQSAALSVNRADDILIVIDAPSSTVPTSSSVECFVNGASIGTVSMRNNLSVSALRVEQTNGATAAIYSLKIAPPALYNARG